ncbi:hypothetical protein [Paratractidigestivibacter sp.]|uniref:hypothetical protein n=1 Tax=Paratractidigestivibacter sp. TaxID=2847316 RepID=UPI0040278AB7
MDTSSRKARCCGARQDIPAGPAPDPSEQQPEASAADQTVAYARPSAAPQAAPAPYAEAVQGYPSAQGAVPAPAAQPAPRRSGPSVGTIVAVVVAAIAVMGIAAFAFFMVSDKAPDQAQTSEQTQPSGSQGGSGVTVTSKPTAGKSDSGAKQDSDSKSKDEKSKDKDSGSDDQVSPIEAAKKCVTTGSGKQTYSNPRFGYSVTLPSTYELIDASANGDGVTFRESSTGIEVRTWGGSNASGQTLQSVLDSYTSAHNVDYKATGKTWVVASWKENGNEYYAKQYVGSNYVNGIEFGYPRTSADAGSAVIEAYINDYHPGDL